MEKTIEVKEVFLNLTKEEILENIRIGFCRKDDERFYKRETQFEGIHKYLYIIRDNVTFYPAPTILELKGIDFSEAWNRAYDNTEADCEIKGMTEILKEAGDHIEGDEIAYIVTNKEAMYGAAAMLNMKKVCDFLKDKGMKQAVVMFSSVHEAIICEYTRDIKEYNNMMIKGNEKCSSGEALATHAHIITL